MCAERVAIFKAISEGATEIADTDGDRELERALLGDVADIENLTVVTALVDNHRDADPMVHFVGFGLVRKMSDFDEITDLSLEPGDNGSFDS